MPADTALEPRFAKALSHPLRMRILGLLDERVSSPVELARELDEPLGNVSYHVKMLAELDCIELVRTEPRRGAVEHYYRTVGRPFISDEAWASLPQTIRRGVADGVLGEVARDLAKAGKRGGFDRDEVHLTRTPLALDEQGWRELGELLGDVLERARTIQADSAQRTGEPGGEDAVSSNLVMLLFEQPPSASSRGK